MMMYFFVWMELSTVHVNFASIMFTHNKSSEVFIKAVLTNIFIQTIDQIYTCNVNVIASSEFASPLWSTECFTIFQIIETER